MPEKLQFKATISRMGRRRVINIPQALYLLLKPYEGKEVKVTIEELK